MLVSHESPLKMLEKSRSYNDYDYALVHLFEEHPTYLEFFKKSLEQGRTVYLDNSIFELGEAFRSDKYIEYIEKLQEVADQYNNPNFYYIVPDVLNDYNATISKFEEFSKLYNTGKRIGVAQGATKSEFFECFEYMMKRCDVVALPFDSNWMLEIGEGKTTELRFSDARQKTVKELNEVYDLSNVKIHLLGCFTPQEFKAYKDCNFVVSLDTSNPVVHGILNIKYGDDGLDTKNPVKLADLIDYDGEQDVILYNVKKFKEINGL